MAMVIGKKRAMLRRYGVGIDIHQEFAEVCVTVPNHDTLDINHNACTFGTNPDELKRAHEWVLNVIREGGVVLHPSDLYYAIESTGTLHLPLVRKWGGKPCIINPGLAAQFKARKTDKWDAAQMSQQALTGLFDPTYLPGMTTEVARVLLRTRKRFGTVSSRCLNQIGTRLTQFYVPIPKSWPGKRMYRNLIEDYAAKRVPIIEDPKAAGIFKEAHLVPDRVYRLITDLYRYADYFNVSADECLKDVIQYIPEEKFEILTSVPAVGPIVAATWWAEVEPCDRFTSIQACMAFCGLDPTPRISAGKVVSERCRPGNKFIRTALIQSGQLLLRMKCQLGQTSREKTRAYKTKVFDASRRIARTLYGCSMNNTIYRDDHHGKEA